MNDKYELLPIPGWEGLYATIGDQIISLRTGKHMKPGLAGTKRKQYYSVALSRLGQKPKRMYVHRLVLSSKLGRLIAAGMQVDHIDGNHLNNFPENLRELSNQDNIQAGFDLKRAAGKTSTNHRGVSKHENGYCVYVGIEGISLRVGHYDDYDTACKVADDAFAGILTPKVQARLEKLKNKKKNKN